MANEVCTDLCEIASFNPRLAYTLANAGAIKSGTYLDAGGWEVVNVAATFSTADDAGNIPAETTVKGQLFGTIQKDLWIRKVIYTVRRPNAYAGNIFKAQSDFFNSKNPNIDFQLVVNSYDKYVISSDFTPVEDVEMVFEAAAPAGLVLGPASSVEATFINRRVFFGGQNLFRVPVGENPTQVILSFHGTRLPSDVYSNCDLQEATKYLREKGIWPSSPDVVKQAK